MNIQLPQIIFQIINFSVVLGALSYLLYKPILKMLDERAERIQEAQKAAAKTLEEQAKIEQTTKSTKQKAEREAQEILNEAKAAATAQKLEILKAAQEEAEQQLSKVKKDWQAEKAKLASEMKQDFAEAVLTVSEKVIGKSLDKKTHQALIDDGIKAIVTSL